MSWTAARKSVVCLDTGAARALAARVPQPAPHGQVIGRVKRDYKVRHAVRHESQILVSQPAHRAAHQLSPPWPRRIDAPGAGAEPRSRPESCDSRSGATAERLDRGEHRHRLLSAVGAWPGYEPT